jgi:hypothetical protein
MPNSAKYKNRQKNSLRQELLEFYDEFTALNASSAFVMQALASAIVSSGGLDERSASGAVFCAQSLNDRTIELEQRLKKILSQAQGSAQQAISKNSA